MSVQTGLAEASILDIANSQFLKGFISGQIVLVILGIFLFQLMFLRGPFDLARSRKGRHATQQAQVLQQQVGIKDSSKEAAHKSINYRDILTQVGYNPAMVQAETCQWLNVLIGQVLGAVRGSPRFSRSIHEALYTAINAHTNQSKSEAPDGSEFRILDSVKLTHVTLGKKLPRIPWAKVNYSESGRIRLDIKIEWLDDLDLSVGLEGQLAMNWPVNLFAALPFHLQISLVKITGTLSIELLQVEGASSDEVLTQAQVTFLHDSQFEFEIKSLLGHKTKLKDLPKVSEILSQLIRNSIEEEIVWPNFKIVNLPFL